MNKKKLITFIILIALIISFFYSKYKEETKIVFIGALSGDYAKNGRESYKGVELALEENNNKNIKIIKKNNKSNEKINKKIAKEIYNNKDIKLYLNANYSSTFVKNYSFIKDKEDKLVFTLLANANCVKGKNLIQIIYPNNKNIFFPIIKYLKSKKLNKVCIIHQNNNLEYVESSIKNLKIANKFLGNKLDLSLCKYDGSAKSTINKLDLKNIDAIFMILETFDITKITQYMYVSNIKKQLIITADNLEPLLIEDGGKSIENLLVSAPEFFMDNELYEKFEKKYYQRYFKKPSVYSAFSYIGAKKIISSVKKCGNNAKCIKKDMLETNLDFFGKKITYNSDGTLKMNFSLATFKNCKLKKIK